MKTSSFRLQTSSFILHIMEDFRFYIKVLAGARQGERIEIPPQEELTKAAPCAWIQEDEEICFMLVAPAYMENPVLWISDLPKPPSDCKRLSNKVIYLWHPESRGFNRYQAFFLNCFGSCQLDVEVRRKDGGRLWIELRPFEVRARKITADRLREIISYLASRMDDLPGSIFSVTQVSAGKQRRNVTTLMKEAEEGLVLFERHLPVLLGKHCTRLVPRRVVRMPRPGDCFDANTAEWLLSHLDILVPAAMPDEAVAVIDNRAYTASRLEVSELVEDSDVYENRVLHSFLNNIKTFLVEIRKACDRIESQGPDPDAWHTDEGKGRHGDAGRYVSFSREIKTSMRELFRGRKTKCDRMLERCNYLMSVAEERIPVGRLMSSAPSMTPWVKANAHYRVLFEKIIRWYQMGSADWSDEEALAGVRSIDELYEYFCLYRLIDGLEKAGFRRQGEAEGQGEEPAPSPDSSLLAPRPRHRYEFRRGHVSLTLCYEKEIWSPRHGGSGEDRHFNVEGWVWESYRRKGANAKRVPDYIFEIREDRGAGSGACLLAVFDAKYSPPDTVFFEKLPMLVMRYVHGISGKKGGQSPVISLYLFHPKEDARGVDPIRSFHTREYDIFGDKAVIPALGAAELDPASTWDIARLINRIVELALRRIKGLGMKG